MSVLSWVQNWSACANVGDKPDEEPYITSTPPASNIEPIFSNGVPIAKSSLPSALKSPAVSEEPNLSLNSAISSILVLSCVQNWSACADVADKPDEEPYITCTAPALILEPKSSTGTPTTKSSNPSALKSPITKERPNISPVSA